jgi:hypothetical protein
MPTIQSKKYESHVHYVTVESWRVFKDKGLDRRYTVIDDTDIQDTVIATPQAFEPLHTLQMEEPEMNREELKKWLDEHDIEYSPRISTPKLYQLYLDNKL